MYVTHLNLKEKKEPSFIYYIPSIKLLKNLLEIKM